MNVIGPRPSRPRLKYCNLASWAVEMGHNTHHTSSSRRRRWRRGGGGRRLVVGYCGERLEAVLSPVTVYHKAGVSIPLGRCTPGRRPRWGFALRPPLWKSKVRRRRGVVKHDCENLWFSRKIVWPTDFTRIPIKSNRVIVGHLDDDDDDNLL